MVRQLELDYDIDPRPRYPWGSPHEGLRALLARNERLYAGMLRRLAALAGPLGAIPASGRDAAPGEPFWDNAWIPPLDAVSIYGLLTVFNPALYFEVGSGNSTRFARRAIRDGGLRTRIVSIDPEPRADIDALCDELHRQPFEALDPGLYAALPPDSVVFVDNSHRCFQNSDAVACFLDLVPALPSGAVLGLHDIFLPYDYPAEWAGRYYSEQYLLASFLLGGGGGFEVLLPACHVSQTPELARELAPLFALPELSGREPLGVGFWLRRS